MREFIFLLAITLALVVAMVAIAPRGAPIPVADCIGCG
jgi:hypothetical protein